MKTYIISCPNSPRRATIAERAQQLDNYEIHDALIGARLGLTCDLPFIPDSNTHAKTIGWHNMNYGLIGLHFSNLMLWTKCNEREDDIVLILEDDFRLHENFQEKLAAIISRLPEDWLTCNISRDVCAAMYRKSILPFIIKEISNVASAPIDVLLRKFVYPKLGHKHIALSEGERIVDNVSTLIGETENTGGNWKTVPGFPNFNYQNLYDEVLDRAVCKDGQSIFLEIGSWEGQSSAYMGEGIRKRFLHDKVKFYCIDTWKGTPSDEWHLKYVRDRGGDLFPSWQKNMRTSGNDEVCIPMQMTSEEAIQKFEDKTIDFAWVDADHTYEACKADILGLLPKMKENGVLAGHDYDMVGVRQAVEEIFPTKYRTVGNSWIYDPTLKKSALISGKQSVERAKQRHQEQLAVALEKNKLPPANRPKLSLYSCIHRSQEVIGLVPCGCATPPTIHRCAHPDLGGTCVRLEEQGGRRELILKGGHHICQLCSLRVKEPGTCGTIEEWKESKVR